MTLYVNGEAVEQSLIDNEIQRLRPSYERFFTDMDAEPKEQQLREWARENIIEAMLFRQQARKQFAEIDTALIEQYLNASLQQESETGPLHQRMSSGPQEQARLRKEITEQMQHEQLTEKVTAGIDEPTEKAIEKYYRDHLDRFSVPELVHAAHIVKHPDESTSPEELQSQIEALYQRLEAGEDFETLATETSDCPEQGGDLGFFARGKMVPTFEEVAFSLEPGTYSKPFTTEFGWHIAKVLAKQPATPCPLDQVREVIIRELKQAAKEKAIEQFLDAQKEKAVIEERE